MNNNYKQNYSTSIIKQQLLFIIIDFEYVVKSIPIQ